MSVDVEIGRDGNDWTLTSYDGLSQNRMCVNSSVFTILIAKPGSTKLELV